MILGIDTSNYTTSAALFIGQTMLQKKQLLPVKQGQLGLRQSDALFHHTQQLPVLLEALFSQASAQQPLQAVGVSDKPRNAEGSYMPCFLAGVSAAQSIAAALRLPLYRCSHQQGHLAAALYSAGRMELLEQELLAFHVSGGTTECLRAAPALQAERLGGTSDLNAGQLVDRVGVMLGYAFPAGAALDALAQAGTLSRKAVPSVNGMECSFSGLENKCRAMHESGERKEDIALFCLQSIAVNLEALARQAIARCGEMPLLFTGGVCCSHVLRTYLTKQFPAALFAAPEFSADNAAGVAAIANLMLNS